MKKKLLLFAVVIMAIACLLAVSVSAASSDSDAFGEVTLVDGIPTDLDDSTSKIVLKGADGKYTTYPSYYVFFKTNASNWSRRGEARLDFTDLNNALGLSDDNAYSKASIIRVQVPDDVQYIPSSNFVKGSTTVKEVSFSENSKATTFEYGTFESCTALEKVTIPPLTETLGGHMFNGCKNLTDVKFYSNTTLTYVVSAMFKDCSALEEIVLPNSITKIEAGAFNGCKSLKKLVLGAKLESFSGTDNFAYVSNKSANIALELYVPADLFETSTALSNSRVYSWDTNHMYTVTYYFCGTKEQAEAVVENAAFSNIKNAEIVAWDPLKGVGHSDYVKTGKNVIVYGYNACDAFYDAKHDLGTVNSCMVDVECERTCGYSIVSEFDAHKMVETLVYENGFDKNGVYNCICSNASYCTSAEGYAVNVDKAPIITAKGYSVPLRAGAEIAINAGFDVKTDLLKKFEELNPESTVTIGLAMVNADTAISAGAILNGEELATNVKGFVVKVTSNSYSAISIEIKGFEDNGDNTGSYYDLKLITVAYVKIDDEIHYIQHGGSATTTETIGDVAYKVVTANSVYSATA